MDRLLATIRAAPPRAGATRVVAIDGRSGSGKSSLARALAAALDDAPLVSLEDLYGGWDGLQRGIALLCSAVLEPLAAGRPASVPRYDWAAAAWLESWTLEPPAALLVEGVGAGAVAAARFTSVLLWLEAGPAERRQRVRLRDGDDAQWQRWAAQEDAYIERDRPAERAEVVISSGAGRRLR